MKKNFIVCFLLCIFISFKTFAVPTPDITADGAILLEPTTNTILYTKNGNTRFYPASTTKVLTSLLLLEATSPTVALTKTAASVRNVPSDSSHIGLSVGNQYSYLDGIHAILLGSDNFVSYDMATHNAGSIEAFAKKMNDRAKALGATSSHFVNPHGYHDPNHYTTPYDLALITKAAFSNLTLAKIAGKTNYDFTIRDTNQKLSLSHTSELLHKSSDYYNPHVIATKTGFHTPAGRVLVAKAHYNDIDLIGIVMKTTSPNQFADMNALFDFGAKNFKLIQTADGTPLVANISFSPWAKSYVEYALDHNWMITSTKSFQDTLTVREFIGLLSHTLPSHAIPLLSTYIHPTYSPVYAESLPITQGQAASILYDISSKLMLTQHTLYKELSIPNLSKLPTPMQKEITFSVSTGLLGHPKEAFLPDVALTYEQTLAIAYRFAALFNTTFPYNLLEPSSPTT